MATSLLEIEVGKLDLDPGRFEVRDSLTKLLRMTPPRAQGKGIDLSWQVVPDVPEYVEAEEARLRQVLVTLAGYVQVTTPSIRDREEVDARSRVIIALTAHSMKGDRECCLQSGMNAFAANQLRLSSIDSYVAENSVPLWQGFRRVLGGGTGRPGYARLAVPAKAVGSTLHALFGVGDQECVEKHDVPR